MFFTKIKTFSSSLDQADSDCKKRLNFTNASSGYSSMDPSAVTSSTDQTGDFSGDTSISEGIGCGPSEISSNQTETMSESGNSITPEEIETNSKSVHSGLEPSVAGASGLSVVAPVIPASTSLLTASGLVKMNLPLRVIYMYKIFSFSKISICTSVK